MINYFIKIRFEIDSSSILFYPVSVQSVQSLPLISPVITNITFSSYIGINDNSFTVLNFTRYVFLRRIEIGNECFKYVREFVIDGLTNLESVKIDERCFTIGWEERDDGVCRITNCPNLCQLEIDYWSFEDFKSFELSNLNSLQSIKFGRLCFKYADCSLKGE